MTSRELAKKLYESRLTPGTYNPSSSIKSSHNLVLTINGIPVLGVGEVGNQESLHEANSLLESDSFKDILKVAYRDSIQSIAISEIFGSDINWKDTEFAVVQKEANTVEYGDETGDLHWIVFGENAQAIATALCINKEIQHIAYNNEDIYTGKLKPTQSAPTPTIDECLEQIDEEEAAKQNVKSPSL